jgi:hypothetical protein
MFFKPNPAENDLDDMGPNHDQDRSGSPPTLINPKMSLGLVYPLRGRANQWEVYMGIMSEDTTFNELVHFLDGFNYYSLLYEPYYGYAILVYNFKYLHHCLLFIQGFHHIREAEAAIDYINGRTLHGDRVRANWRVPFP